MAKTPQELAKYGGSASSIFTNVDDNGLVRWKHLKAIAAMIIRMIPGAGAGFALRNTPDGDVWTKTESAKPFQVSSKGVVHPGLVGGKMPTLGGTRLDDASVGVIDLTANSGSFKVYFKLTFSVTYLSGFLSAYTLSTVTVESLTSTPSDTDSVKYLQFNTITNAAPRASFFSSSISVNLYDNGSGATGLHYASA